MAKSRKIIRIVGVFLLLGTPLRVPLSEARGLGVRWGLLSPLTGEFETLGRQELQGSILALELLRASRRLFEDLEWFVEDTAFKPSVAVEKANKLIEKNGVQFITGCINNGSALAVREVIDRHRVFFNPMVETNMFNTSDPKCSRNGFRTELMTWQIVKSLVHMVRGLVKQGKLGKRYWLVIPEYPYGFPMGDSWRKMTRDFLEEVGYAGEKGFRLRDHTAKIAEISAARDAGKVDFIASGLLGTSVVTFMQQAHAAGLIGTEKGRLPVVNPVLQFNIREIGDISLGHYSAYRYSLIQKSRTNQRFIWAYYKRWGIYPDNFAHNAYVAVIMMGQGIEGAKSIDPEKVLAELETEREYSAPMGTSYFRAFDHQIVRDIGAGQVVKVDGYPFPVMKLVGRMLNGEEAIAGIEERCVFK